MSQKQKQYIVIFSEVEVEQAPIRKVVSAGSPAEATFTAILEYHKDEYDEVCTDFGKYGILAVYLEKHDKTDYVQEDTFSDSIIFWVDDYDFDANIQGFEK